jgi:glycosyltransferase involved in cell wall biosynthesis
MLTIIHDNPIRGVDGLVTVDRKFLDGMARFVAAVGVPVTSTHPVRSDMVAIDSLSVSAASLPFRLVGLATDGRGSYTTAALAELDRLVRGSVLVVGSYIGGGLRMARAHGKPYVMAIEYDLATQCKVAALAARDPLRGFVRRLRVVRDYFTNQVADMRGAAEIHCNGFPVYEQAKRRNRHCLLYLDSRMSADMVIDEARLMARLAGAAARRPRVIFSGRYEAMKGALDFVRAAIACRRAGLDAEFVCYGQGSQAEAMRRTVAAAREQEAIRVEDAVPFAELVERSRECDLFLACHVQSDPSCSYLEAMGCGLPVVGYANRMAAGVCADSGAGLVTPIGDLAALVGAVCGALGDRTRLAEWSVRARAYALEHCFEVEFAKRASMIRARYDAALGAPSTGLVPG